MLALPFGSESGVAGLAAAIVIANDQSGRKTCGFNEESRVLVIGSEAVTDPYIHARIMAG